ncbi:MAG: Rrf2 family transcriptional regulator [Chloroflexota bacterium]
MKLSTRARYGTRALLDLGMNKSGEPVQLRDIARRQGISLSYLEHLITPLVASGFIRSARGSRGGVWLAKPPEQIRLIEVVELLEGSIMLVECLSDPSVCPRSGYCATQDIWCEMARAMAKVLESTTLRDLVERQRGKPSPGDKPMYFI